MDVSEKDAARSKWRLSRKHNQRGRGQGPSSASQQRKKPTPELGTNADRYEEEDVDGDHDHEHRPSGGGGADLAEWLLQYPPQDPVFYARQRVNIHEDVGLPEAQPDSFQGLAFDLDGLAEVLSQVPLHRVLHCGTDQHPLDEEEIETDEEEREEEENVVSRAPPPLLPPTDGGGEEEKRIVESMPPLQPPPPPPPPPPPLEQTKNQMDDELDELLGLGPGGGKAVGKTTVTSSDKEKSDHDSLEAWLDTL